MRRNPVALLNRYSCANTNARLRIKLRTETDPDAGFVLILISQALMLGLTRGGLVMRKILLALTTVVAVGALTAPMAALAASNHSGGGNAGGSRVSTGMT